MISPISPNLGYLSHPYSVEYMNIHVQSALMHTGGQSWIEALCQTLADDQFVRDEGEIGKGLEALDMQKVRIAMPWLGGRRYMRYHSP